MAILIPSLDDRTYEQLADLLRRQIAPGPWTDHNASDPGVMLLEELCWLGEMALYRMDQVPETHEAKFLDLLIDPPEPVTVRVTFTVTFGVPTATPPMTPTTSVTIPAGTQLATDYLLLAPGDPVGWRFVFETFTPLTILKPALGNSAARTIPARAILLVNDEPLGQSSGHPHQEFRLTPPRHALGITAPEAPAPVLTDFVHRTASYEPNPLVTVAGAPWTPVPSLRTEQSRVAPLNPATHYMVSAHGGIIRFGDDVFGAIPPAGAPIACARYRVLDGPTDGPVPPPRRSALTVKENEVKHALNLTLPATDVAVTWTNTAAEGGANFFPASRRFELGLRSFRLPYRLVAERDFERAVLEDFNKFQRFAEHAPQIARAAVVFDRRPPLSADAPAPSHVTLVLLPGPPNFDESAFQNETVAFATKDAMVDLPVGLWERILSFLDRRRLITTRLNREKPELKPLTATSAVVVRSDRNVAEMELALRARVYGFLSLLTGDLDGRGWKLGQSVYRSQLFRLLEDAAGVDHVAALTLSPGDAHGNVVLGPHQFPLLEKLTLTVLRA